MAKRIALSIVAVALVAGAGFLGYRLLRGGTAQFVRSGERETGDAAQARVLLNEVLFQPLPGQPAWVEIINTGSEGVAARGMVLQNHEGASYAMPESVMLPARSVVVVQFDGTARVDGTIVHAEPKTFLHPDTGSVTLLVGGLPVDEAFWSTTGGLSLNLGRGGRVPPFKAGTTVGRPRASVARSPDAWTVFPPAEVTPNALNPYPSVTGLMPLSGAVLNGPVTLSWYSVPTAIRYRVVVAAEPSFAAPVIDRTLDAAAGREPTTLHLQVDLPRSAAYYWRVQAMFDNAGTAAASRTAVFWTRAAAAASIFEKLGERVGETLGFVSAAHAATASDVLRITLPVPLILQGKDTRLLALEAETESGDRPWDAPWQTPPVGPFCGRASIAMVTAAFGGRLSQDRITYEAFKDFKPGPIFDLYTKKGFGDMDIHKAMTYALGGEPALRFNETLTAIRYFELHKEQIDKRMPVVASTDVHVFVVVGYGDDERGKYLVINDPAVGQYDWLLIPRPGMEEVDRTGPFFDENISTSFLLPRNPRGKSDEPEISMDSDGDGVTDFDEKVRFGTSRYSSDSDYDGVGDKQEIRAWVYDEQQGWARTNPAGRPFDLDRDDKRMELDDDSDDGGCFDGLEDANKNGKHEADQKEFYNFKKEDDPCVKGEFTNNADFVIPPNGNQGRKQFQQRHTARFSLRPEPNGVLTGSGHVFFGEELSNSTISESGECKMDGTVGPVQWQVELTGEATPFPDGSVEVKLRADPEKGPAFPSQTRGYGTCPMSATVTAPGHPWPMLGPYKLVNGVYRHVLESPLPPGATGYIRATVTVELQRQPQ